MVNNHLKNKIFNFIKSNESGVSCSEIAKKLKVNRVTLAKYLSVLELESQIFYKGFGMAKVWYIQKNPILESFKGNNGHSIKNVLDSIDDGILVVDNNLDIIWANKALKEMAKDYSDLKNAHFFDIFKEGETLRNDIKTNRIKKTTLENKNNQKVKASISPILNINNDSVGFIHVLNLDNIDKA
ncbi:HTH domain-containing protein [Candidatus Woesearchaeota archaeon]|nr:HTH domain-containing protein [Candidatus Woesearchaeota archaeon]